MTKQKQVADKKLVASGVFWNGVQLAVKQSFSFIVKLILARLLFPEQFGLVGMATVVIGFIQIVNDLGVGAALIQRKKEDLRPEHFHTVFWTGVAWSVALFLFMSLAAGPLAAAFYEEPRLVNIIPVLSLGILFGSLNLVNRSQLLRAMNFKRTAMIDSGSSVFAGCTALILAYFGAGIWALVFNAVAPVIVAIPFYFKSTRWTPRLVWKKQAFKDIFGFGAYVTGSDMISYLYNNIDYLLIGKLMSASALGVYTFAFVLTDTFRGRIMAVIDRAIYPFYGKKQDNPTTLKKYYLKVIQFNCLAIYPIMIFFCVLGGPFLLHFFGEKWEGSVLPLRILSVSVMFHIMVSGNTALLKGLGRPGLEMKLQVLKALIFIPMLVAGIWFYGTAGAAWAVLINRFIAVLIAQYVFKELLPVKISYRDLGLALKAPVLASLIAFTIVYSLNLLGVHYLLAGAALVAGYLLAVWAIMGTELKSLFQGLVATSY